MGGSKGVGFPMLLRLKRRRAWLLLLLILVERLLGAAVVAVGIVSRINSGVFVRRAVKVVVAGVAFAVGVPVVELVVVNIKLVDGVGAVVYGGATG